MKHALITGGAGFIGSHLAETMLAAGWSVECLDDLSTGSVLNVDHLRSNPRFNLRIGSVTNSSDLAEPIDRADVVCHLAAAVGVRLIVERPVHTIETNIRGTENVLALAAKKNKQVLITSTSEVYGKTERTPFGEEDDLVLGASRRPRWAYACSKLIDEFLALAYGREKHLPVIVVRLFNTVGPRQTGRYGMVIPRFIQQALANEPLTVYGDGTQTRTFCHVADAIDGMTRLLATPAALGRVFNIGGQREVSILELARMVIERTGSKSTIELVPFATAYDEDFEDMPRRVPDLTRANQTVGYAPTRSLENIIDDVVAFERSR